MYDIIIGCNIFSELNIDLFFSNNNSRENGGSYKGFTSTMKDISKINFNISSNWIK